jgi:hypothetical protein
MLLCEFVGTRLWEEHKMKPVVIALVYRKIFYKHVAMYGEITKTEEQKCTANLLQQLSIDRRYESLIQQLLVSKIRLTR